MPALCNATIQLNNHMIGKIEEANVRAAVKTAYSIRADVDQEQTVPFLTGQMTQTSFVDISHILTEGIRLKYSVPYAAYQYFTPGLRHTTAFHANATDHWLDPYCQGGTKENFAKNKYALHYIDEIRRIAP